MTNRSTACVSPLMVHSCASFRRVCVEACVLRLFSMTDGNKLGIFRIGNDNSHPNTVVCLVGVVRVKTESDVTAEKSGVRIKIL